MQKRVKVVRIGQVDDYPDRTKVRVTLRNPDWDQRIEVYGSSDDWAGVAYGAEYDLTLTPVLSTEGG